MTTRIGAPQVGQQATCGGGGVRGGGGPSRGCACPIMRRMVVEGDGTSGMEKAEVADFHEAIGQDVLEEPAEKFHAVEVGSAEACTAHFPVGEGDCAVLEADETVVGDGDLEDRGGEVGEGGVAVVLGLTMDVPGDGPDLWVDVRQQSGLAHLFFEESAVDR